VKRNFYKLLIAIIALALITIKNFGQSTNTVQADGSRVNSILTAVPFLLIVPQGRSGSMGNSGVAIDADGNSSVLNSSAMAFLPEAAYGVSLSYSPWLKNLVPDISLSYLSGYYRLNDRNTLGASLRYFSIGNVQFTDNNSQSLGISNPSEWAADISYARSFGPEFSLGGSLRYISSNLFSGQSLAVGQIEPGRAIAVDISGLYRKNGFVFGGPVIWSAGINLSNIGTKISYSTGGAPYFLPSNLRIGSAATFLGNGSRLIFAFDLNKLMVPTQPLYDRNGNIVKGRDPERSVPSGIFGSFSDAPGGVSEELKEVGISTGFEYCYMEQFSFRAGYNYQNPEKGNSSYFTLGAGFKYNILSIDFAYLLSSTSRSPLANTLRFGLQANFGKKSGN